MPGLPLLIKLFDTIIQTSASTPSVLLERWRDTKDEAVLTRLLQWDIPGAEKSADQLKLIDDAFTNLTQKIRETRMQELLNKSRTEALNEAEKQELSELYKS